MNRTLHIDIETYSSAPIDAGVYRYSESPDFRILMAAWSTDGETTHVATEPEDIAAIPGLTDPAVRKVAHNAQFERICLSRLLGRAPGDYLPPEEWRDTMAVAAELGYPQKLEKLALALGAEEKDAAGTRLINIFSKPNRKGTRTLPEERPEDWAAFVEYCRQDVATLIDIDRRLGDWPTETERAVYEADQHINDAGIAVDLAFCRQAVETADLNQMAQELELQQLLGVDNPRSQPQMLAALQATGGALADLADLRKDTVTALLSGTLRPEQRRALELRLELALVTSKKYEAALRATSRDGRLRGSFRFFGAHTGRWAGRGVQLQNLARPAKGFPADDAEIEALILDVKLGLGAEADELKSLVRSMFVGPLTVVDYSAIEARVVAWLAGEQWALDAFAAGRDIYVETAERMSTPSNRLDRSQGKVAVLALGYQGWVNSLRVMGAEGSDEHLARLAKQWRRANPNIVGLWEQTQDVFRTGGRAGKRITLERNGSERRMRLPSGRAIHYHGCQFGDKMSFRDARMGWRVDTYGGRLVENATQAVARDILAEALVRLRDNGFRVVGHVHDEILVETEDVDTVRSLMIEPPTWAAGLPIDGEGFVCRRYRKG